MKIDFNRLTTGYTLNPDETIFHFSQFDERGDEYKNKDAFRFVKVMLLDFLNKNELTTGESGQYDHPNPVQTDHPLFNPCSGFTQYQ